MKRHGTNGARALLAGVALLLALSGGNALAQSAPSDYSALTARSAALTPAQHAQAKQLFATGFSIWQSGDFAAAEIAFKQGLDIDPANALANYYYGDCLARRKDKAEAKDYLARAVALGGDTVEAFKAKAELQALSVAPTDVSDMTRDELTAAYIGKWKMTTAYTEGTWTITAVNGNTLNVTGEFGNNSIERGEINGQKIRLVAPHDVVPDQVLTGTLLTPSHMEGTGTGGWSPWSADKE